MIGCFGNFHGMFSELYFFVYIDDIVLQVNGRSRDEVFKLLSAGAIQMCHIVRHELVCDIACSKAAVVASAFPLLIFALWASGQFRPFSRLHRQKIYGT